MTNEQLQLIQELKSELISRGFEVYNDNYGGNGVKLVKNGDYEVQKEKFFSKFKNEELEITRFKGYSIIIGEVYRHNGTQENVSCFIRAVFWQNNVGSTLKDVKISQKDGARKRQNAINKIVEAYKEAVKD